MSATANRLVQIYSRQYWEGRHAFGNGAGFGDNPYDVNLDGNMHYAWRKGFADALTERAYNQRS